MHPDPRRIAPVVLILALVAFAAWWYFGGGRQVDAVNGALTASGTIEAVQVNIAPELGGRVRAVHVEEGQSVVAGQVLVELDDTLLQAQRAQALAALSAAQSAQAAAEAAAEAADANLRLLQAGPSAEQLALAQTVVDHAQLLVDQLQVNYDDLSDRARDTSAGKALKQQLEQAQSARDNARAQYDLTASGARPEQIQAAQAQAQATSSQAEAGHSQVWAAEAALGVLDVQIAKLTLTAPAAGVVLARSIQPGEIASPGSALLVLGQLADLHITVYVSEDRYGQIRPGQSASVTVDSFPGQSFAAQVVRVADRAEFTPRNVQTEDGRRTTVFAVRLQVSDPQARLKPGMPADVVFQD